MCYVSVTRLQEITHQPLVVVPRIARRVMPAGPPSGHHAAGTPHRVAVHPGQHIGQGTPQMPNRPIQSQSSSTPSSQAISTQYQQDLSWYLHIPGSHQTRLNNISQ